MTHKRCPLCSAPVLPVTYPADSLYNRDQFESMTVGDCYCTTCPEDPTRQAGGGYRYWFEGELLQPVTVRVEQPPPDPLAESLAARQTNLTLYGVISSWADLPAGDYRLVKIPTGADTPGG